MFVSYVVTVAAARRLPPVLVLGSIAALYALILLAPPLASTDIFSYQFYGRIGRVYGFNPYLAGPKALAGDSLYPLIGSKWVGTPTVYGPRVHRAQLSAGAADDRRQRIRVQGDSGRLEPGDRGARVERRAAARHRSGQARWRSSDSTR